MIAVISPTVETQPSSCPRWCPITSPYQHLTYISMDTLKPNTLEVKNVVFCWSGMPLVFSLNGYCWLSCSNLSRAFSFRNTAVWCIWHLWRKHCSLTLTGKKSRVKIWLIVSEFQEMWPQSHRHKHDYVHTCINSTDASSVLWVVALEQEAYPDEGGTLCGVSQVHIKQPKPQMNHQPYYPPVVKHGMYNPPFIYDCPIKSTIWLWHSIKNGKPSISIRVIFNR